MNLRQFWVRKVYRSDGSRILTLPSQLKHLTNADFVVYKLKDDGSVTLEPLALEEV